VRRKFQAETHIFGVGEDNRLVSPAAERNISPLLEALSPVLPKTGKVLELASGTGQHAVAFAKAFPNLVWQPSEYDPDKLPSIVAWRDDAGLSNIRDPIQLDACRPGWAQRHGLVDFLFLVNLTHLISDAELAVLLDEAVQALWPKGLFALYGPFSRDGRTTSVGDTAFHASLRSQDPSIGYKDVELISDTMRVLGCDVTWCEMPANNLLALMLKRM
jgi:SAM-dependent methyltransferase